MREEAPQRKSNNQDRNDYQCPEKESGVCLKRTSIDPQSRAVIRYALETNDPWLAKLVRYADESESNIEPIEFSQRTSSGEADSNEGKVEA
jgi:hypothetical protein